MSATSPIKCSMSQVDMRVPVKHDDRCQARFDMYAIFTLYVTDWATNAQCNVQKKMKCSVCQRDIVQLTLDKSEGLIPTQETTQLPDPYENNPLTGAQAKLRGDWTEKLQHQDSNCTITHDQMVEIFGRHKDALLKEQNSGNATAPAAQAPASAGQAASRGQAGGDEECCFMQMAKKAGIVASIATVVFGIGFMIFKGIQSLFTTSTPPTGGKRPPAGARGNLRAPGQSL